jgi:hypothetical protein
MFFNLFLSIHFANFARLFQSNITNPSTNNCFHMPYCISKFKLTLLLLSIGSLAFAQSASQDSTGYPGDNFSLEGALELFKKSDSPEAFEKALNTKNNEVNNLDLNSDGDIDYIRVIDNSEGDVHAFALQVPISEKESQDIAVIELEKTGKEDAILQIVGNAEVYGDQKLVEPFEEETGSSKKSGNHGPGFEDGPTVRVVVNVYFWPCVRYVYRPSYVVYVSPWGWRAYPTWWSPWRPVPYYTYHRRVVVVHRSSYHVVTTHRVTRAHAVYAPRRTSSTVVVNRTNTVHVSRGRQPVAAPRNSTTVNRSSTNTTVNQPRTNTTAPSTRQSTQPARTQPSTQPATKSKTQQQTAPSTQQRSQPKAKQQPRSNSRQQPKTNSTRKSNSRSKSTTSGRGRRG